MSTHDGRDSEHEFVLVLSGVSELDDRVLNALFEAGCDDATVSLRFGTVSMAFDRRAPTFRRAVMSAIRDVLNAGIGAGVKCIDDGNLVSQADIARRIGRTREMVRQYVNGTRGPGNFPGPACSLGVGHPLWMWCEVSDWLWQNGIVKEDVLQRARIVAGINSALEILHQRQHDSGLVDEVLQLAGKAELCESA